MENATFCNGEYVGFAETKPASTKTPTGIPSRMNTSVCQDNGMVEADYSDMFILDLDSVTQSPSYSTSYDLYGENEVLQDGLLLPKAVERRSDCFQYSNNKYSDGSRRNEQQFDESSLFTSGIPHSSSRGCLRTSVLPDISSLSQYDYDGELSVEVLPSVGSDRFVSFQHSYSSTLDAFSESYLSPRRHSPIPYDTTRSSLSNMYSSYPKTYEDMTSSTWKRSQSFNRDMHSLSSFGKGYSHPSSVSLNQSYEHTNTPIPSHNVDRPIQTTKSLVNLSDLVKIEDSHNSSRPLPRPHSLLELINENSNTYSGQLSTNDLSTTTEQINDRNITRQSNDPLFSQQYSSAGLSFSPRELDESDLKPRFGYPCRDYEKGVCCRADKCKFYHDPRKGMKEDNIPICRDYQKGKCHRENCRFRHLTK